MTPCLALEPGAPNSAKFRGGCRGPAKIRQRGVAIFFYFLRVKNIAFRVSTLSDLKRPTFKNFTL